MRKLLFFVFLFISLNAYAANNRVVDLPTNTTPTADDITYCADGGTVDKNCTLSGIAAVSGFTDDGVSVRLTDSTDNVGIGTAIPSYKLEVIGEINASGLKVNGSDVCLYGTDCGYVSAGGWTDGGSTIYTTNTGDNVGIGTTSAATALHVKGAATFDGATSGFLLANNMKVDGDTTRKLCFSQTSGTNNEKGCFDFDTTANTWGIESSTGITTMSAPDFAFIAGSLKSTSTLNIGASYYSAQTPPTNGAIIQGNVGIGTFDPGSYRLKVNGTVFANQYDTIPSNTPQTQYSPILTNDTHWIIGQNSDGDNTSNDSLYVSEGTDITTFHRLTINPGGNIGIGTNSPISTLQINGTATATAFVGDGSGLTGLSGGSWVDGGTNVYVSPTTDNVAIGTTTPTSKLTVAGTISATAFTGDGSGLTGISGGSGGWTDGGTNVYPTLTTDNIAIGTTTPFSSSKITVKGGTATDADDFIGLFVQNGVTPDVVGAGSNVAHRSIMVQGDGAAYIGGRDVTNDIEFFMGTSITGVGFGGTTSSHPFQIRSAGTSRMQFGTDGNVGIGTSTPNARLTVMGTGTGATPIQTWRNSSSTQRMVVMDSGVVGIGTAGPRSTLDVAGDVTVGNGAFTNTSANEDLYVEGNLEVDGTVYGDGSGLTNLSAGGWTDGGAFVYATTSTDNVGIGTTAPNQKFQIKESSTANTSFESWNTNASGLASFRAVNDTNKRAQLVCTGGSYVVPNVCGMLVTTGDKFSIGEEDGTQNVTVDGNGNVGIGSTSPNSILNIPSLKSTTGTRYLCIGTTGIITSSATACSGT